jgi:3-deoxy-D-manno-octulosonic-acid transferase
VHAVSVGEVMAAAPVLRELRGRFPDALIVLSTTTIGGREVAQKQTPAADEVVYYPLDFPWVVRRALRQVQPDVVLLMEWEIWPNFLTEAKKQGAKVAVLNGRISDKGLRRGKSGIAAFFTAPSLAAVDRLAMQSDEDARRAILVGAAPERVQTFGNTKFDESSTPLTPNERAALRADLGIPPQAPVWICGSTRDGEEALIASAVRCVWEEIPDLFLIVAPRHLTRADEAAAALELAASRCGDGARARLHRRECSSSIPSASLPARMRWRMWRLWAGRCCRSAGRAFSSLWRRGFPPCSART